MNLLPKISRYDLRVLPAVDTADLEPAAIAAPLSRIPAIRAANGDSTVEELLAEARREGFEWGRMQALAEPAAEAERARTAALAAFAAQIHDAVVAVAAERQAIVDGVVGEVVDLAFELLHTLVDEELALREEPVRDAARRALKLVPSDEALVVRINPRASLEPAELMDLVPGRQVTIVVDPSIEENGCVIEAGPCRVDAQIGPALARVRERLADLRTEEAEPQ